MIRFDRTQRSVVALCACGAREVCYDQAEADRWVAAHIERAHPVPLELLAMERRRAITASRVRRHRRADTP